MIEPRTFWRGSLVLEKQKNSSAFIWKGAILVEIGEKEYALVYKGEKLIQGTSNDKKLLEFYRKLNKVTRKSINIEEFLEESLNNAKFLNVLPKNCEIRFDKEVYNFIDLTTKETVGFVEIIDNKLGFAIFRKGLKTKISGQEVFNSLIEYLKLNKIEFDGILGIWGKESDNTSIFNDAILRGFSNEKAAFETWTGKRAIEQGLNKVKINNLSPNSPPYTSILVTFYK